MTKIKKLCKKIDITDWKTVLPWVYDCIMRHKKRHDFRTLLLKHGLNRKDYNIGIASYNYELWDNAIQNIAKEACQRIYERDVDLPPPRVKQKYDPTSRKTRDIGCECAMQQIYDFIAVNGSIDVFNRRITSYQASSIKDRGQIYGINLIKKWVIKAKTMSEYKQRRKIKYLSPMKYFVKLDIEKCFPNCRAEYFLKYFKKDCGNLDLIWLWECLLLSHRIDDEHQGFMIGAYTSQYAAQYMISFAYSFVMNLHKYKVGRKKPVKLVSHMIMFMDDILLCSSSRQDLKDAIRYLTDFMLNEFHLTIKNNWHIKEFTETTGIDMMGYVIYPSGKITICGKDWIKIRRMLLRSNLQKGKVSYRQAKRLVSYKGFIKYSNSSFMQQKYKIEKSLNDAANIISDIERAK